MSAKQNKGNDLMAKGGNGKAQAKGHENANENFANGMCENGAPNENAAKGLENALSHNPFECSGTVIDFDSGVNTVTFDGYYITGLYTEDGYTLEYYSYDWYSYGDLENPIHDSDGSGENEFGMIYADDGYYYYGDAGFTITADDGSAFSLDGFDLSFDYDGNSGFGEYASFYVYESDATYYSYTSAYTPDNVTWYTYEYYRDYTTGITTNESGSTTDMDELLALFGDQTELRYYATDEFTIDDIEVSELMAA